MKNTMKKLLALLLALVLTLALAACGSKVLQIGCDPKHDSTRLLHHGRKVVTILDYLLNTPEDEQKLDDVLMTGFLDTGCVEAGGPRPGMGCAGPLSGECKTNVGV